MQVQWRNKCDASRFVLFTRRGCPNEYDVTAAEASEASEASREAELHLLERTSVIEGAQVVCQGTIICFSVSQWSSREK